MTSPLVIFGSLGMIVSSFSSRILIVTAQFERVPSSGRPLTNFLLELGLLGFLALALAVAVRLIGPAGSSPD